MFCSDDCEKKAASYHLNGGFAELYTGTFERSLKIQLEAFRVAGGVTEALELLKDCKDKTIFDFDLSNPDDPSYEKKMLIALNGLDKHARSHEICEADPKALLNIPPINEKPRNAAEREQLMKFIRSQAQIYLSNFSIFPNHDGIFLLKGLLNHSCAPNVESVKIDEKSVLIVTRPIEAGKELFCAYGGNLATSRAKNERQNRLQKYRFECDCEACVNDWPQPYPERDHRFAAPGYFNYKPAAAVEQFKKNCKYIDENAGNMPCFEISSLMHHNYFLLHIISGNKTI